MAKTKKKSEPKAADAYARVVDHANLEAVSLVNLNFSVKPTFFTKRSEIELGYEIGVEENSYNRETGSAISVIDCSVTAVVDEEKLFDCEAKYIVLYSILEECDEDAVQSFLNRVAVFACYPYFRSVVASVDWAAGTQLPPMPVHRENNAVQARGPKATSPESGEA
ncbi:protein-export chaperone SecB [Oryzifoliimicrobium ureilyticus]|uniref:protein-export chaperone SecB n=1 Tax=Oryzifoliimicrobium ureilyticus TaxID=3113724 RepID=UPI0030764AC7